MWKVFPDRNYCINWQTFYWTKQFDRLFSERIFVLKWIRKEFDSRDDKKFVQSVKWVVSRSDRNIDILSGYTGCEIKIWYRYADWFALTFFSRCLLPATGWPRYKILKNKIDPFNGTVVSVDVACTYHYTVFHYIYIWKLIFPDLMNFN